MEGLIQPLSKKYFDKGFLELIHWQLLDIVVGLIGTFFCVITLFVFLSSRKFFRSNKLLTLLAAGDFFTCLGILTMGFIRKKMYTMALKTNHVYVENTWSCAVKPFVFLRLLGSLIPPGVVFWMSVERFFGVFSPITYRMVIVKHTRISPLVIIIYVTIATIIAYLIAWLNHLKKSVPFYCGRKVSFTVYYSSYVYCASMTGFIMALILNVLTLCKLANLYAKQKNSFEVKRQLKRVRYMIVISLVSTIFVALPNAMSIFSAWFKRIDIRFSEPAIWLIVLKSSINLFVYLLLKTEFRQRVYEILGCLNIEDQKRKRVFDVSMLPSPGLKVKNNLSQKTQKF